ncbi:14238_t:CDS:2, partial [Cetraspora pellucida]
CLKQLLHSSNVSLHELMNEIHQLLDLQDKKKEYNFWKLAISCINNQKKTNFLFKKVDECLERILTPVILQKQCDEINQSIYYKVIKILENDIEADKFYNEENLVEETAPSITYLCAFSCDNQDFFEESLNMLQQRKEFTEQISDSSEDSSSDKGNSNKENQEFVLLNPKKRCSK